jgi:hypothetical protein
MLTGSGEAKGVACSERHRGNFAFDPRRRTRTRSPYSVPLNPLPLLEAGSAEKSLRSSVHYRSVLPPNSIPIRRKPLSAAQIDRGKRRDTVRTYQTRNIAHRAHTTDTSMWHTKLCPITMLQDDPSVSIISKSPVSPLKAPHMLWCRRLIASHRYSHPIGRRCSAHGSVPNSTWVGAGAGVTTNVL